MSRLVAGAARVDITPADLAGLDAMGMGFTGVHDRLFARTVVVSDGVGQVAIVSLDLLEYGEAGPLLARIEAELGIPAAAILIVASHAHNAPRAGATPAGGLSRPPTSESLAFTAGLDDLIVESIRLARATMRPARIGVAKGQVDVNVNRDEFKDGAWRLGVDPAGPSDKTITVLAIESADGVVATLLNYGVHATVALGVPLLSADLAGAAATAVERSLGGVACWLPGALGDQAPCWSLEIARRAGAGPSQGGDPSPQEVFDRLAGLGETLADEAVRLTGAITDWTSDGTVAGGGAEIACPSKKGTEQAHDMRQDDVAAVALRASVIRVGPHTLAGIGGELTTKAAAILRAVLPGGAVMVSLANQRVGYLADPVSFERGTFEARGCPVADGWLSLVGVRLANLAGELR